MAKLYSKKNKTEIVMNPRDETISFILNYSKALRVITHKNMKFESLQN
ncbi:hypothetical protein [Bizionia paragorgiae]|uniref:Uncharacterized protein n=1 Tax=Bizionia paragorgiae TaxID=283786 RepID=A0A1H4A5M8_BIZPA|nr:hypothetical protein [Bizionia paragorgiae]MDX1272288.1 hypothetical protein [Bizionia paragorgiae]SEA31118.1 hypothetical protein SAMN04487990_11012 [Bizionia paragorgiae]